MPKRPARPKAPPASLGPTPGRVPRLGRRGPGRPRTDSATVRAIGEDVCQLLATGVPIAAACGACGLARSLYYQWLRAGEADIAAGRRTALAEFADNVSIYEAIGEVATWAPVPKALATPTPDNIAAGKLALAAWAVRYGGKARRGGREEEPEVELAEPGSAAPTPAALDLSVYTPEERFELRRLLAKGRRTP